MDIMRSSHFGCWALCSFSLVTLCAKTFDHYMVFASGTAVPEQQKSQITIEEVKKAIDNLIEDKDFLKGQKLLSPLKERLKKMNTEKPITQEDVRIEEHFVEIGMWLFDPKGLTVGISADFPDNMSLGLDCKLVCDPQNGWTAIVTRTTIAHIKSGPGKR